MIGADNEIGGVCTDVWVDRAEAFDPLSRSRGHGTAAGAKRVLLPMTFAWSIARGRVTVEAILGSQFADVPATKSPDQVTKLEEDRIVGYFGAGTLYATPVATGAAAVKQDHRQFSRSSRNCRRRCRKASA